MIRYLVGRALVELALNPSHDLAPGERAFLERILDGLDFTRMDEARQRAWDLVAEEVARMVADGWDQYGAPTVAAYAQGRFFAHYTGPRGQGILEAPSKREAYRLARRAWIKEILKGA